MREIINVQLGQCGNNAGLQFLQTITQQHAINQEGKYIGSNDYERERANVYFNQIATNTYNARTILADLQPGVIDYIRGKPIGRIYDPDNFIVEMGSASSNWAIGYYQKGYHIIERLIDAVRRQADNCDHLEGFQLVHSMGGGTGSGLGSLLVERLADQYQDRIIQNFSVYPSSNVSDTVSEPYNTTLALSRHIQHVDLCNVIENAALLRICEKKLKIKRANYSNLNAVLSRGMSDITCGLRFPGQINSSLRKQAVNLVVYPRLHFFINSISPLAAPTDNTRSNTPFEIISQLWDKNSFLSTAVPKSGRYITASLTFRGKVPSSEAETLSRKLMDRNSKFFVQWVSNGVQCSLCDIAPPGQPISGVWTGNSSTLKPILQKIYDNFSTMFRKKAFVHWYTTEGMDQMQLTETSQNLRDLISEFDWSSPQVYGVEQYYGIQQ